MRARWVAGGIAVGAHALLFVSLGHLGPRRPAPIAPSVAQAPKAAAQPEVSTAGRAAPIQAPRVARRSPVAHRTRVRSARSSIPAVTATAPAPDEAPLPVFDIEGAEATTVGILPSPSPGAGGP